jgi:hypothetical protein
VRDQGGLIVPSLSIAALEPGDYNVIVTADFEDGSQSISRPSPVKVERGAAGVVLALLLLLLVGFLGWRLVRRASQRTDGHPRKKEDEDT